MKCFIKHHFDKENKEWFDKFLCSYIVHSDTPISKYLISNENNCYVFGEGLTYSKLLEFLKFINVYSWMEAIEEVSISL